MRRRLFVALVSVSAMSLAVGLAVALPESASTPALSSNRVTVGSVVVHRCPLVGPAHPAYCGSIKVPLNYNAKHDGKITAGFAWLPATEQLQHIASYPTIVAEEGGPGYPSTGSATDFVRMLGKYVLADHNLLLVDERGTGTSTPINCKPMESIHIVTQTPAFSRTVRECGNQLNHTFPRKGGGYVYASDLFTTANATRDMNRVLNQLAIQKVDLYGDSYGTYFSQAFMSRFPNRVTSVTLDSAYEARDLDPWYRTTVTTARAGFDKVCNRSAACHEAAPGKSWNRITRLAALLRKHPVAGRAPGVDARDVPVTVTITSLVNLVNDAGYDYDPYRQLDAAARAYLQHRDARPLLRLYAQDIGDDYSDYNAASSYYSDGQYFAVGCSDYPQLFNMRASSAKRKQQFRRAVQSYPKSAFAPFTTREWVGVDPFTETYHACASWPRRKAPADPPVPHGRSLDPSHAPVLILNGEIDSLTPAAGGAHIRRQIGSAARHIVTANTVHLVGLDDRYGCGETLVRRFITDPAKLHTMSAKCAAKVPALPAVGTFPQTVKQAGSGGTRKRLQTIAIAAARDAAVRWNYVDGSKDVGLRGGTISYSARPKNRRGHVALLHADRWTVDSTVTGRVAFTPDGLNGHGTLTVKTGAGHSTHVRLRWTGQIDQIVSGHRQPGR